MQAFTFPAGFTLSRGAVVTVWSGPGSKSHVDPPRHLAWTRRYIWNDKGDKAILVDAAGAKQQEVDCTPVPASDVVKTVRWCAGERGGGGGLPSFESVVRCLQVKKEECTIM